MSTENSMMLEGSVSSVLFKMTMPITFGMLSTFLFQVIDTYFVGQVGADALAALSFASPVYLIVVSLFIGASVGVSALVANTLGQGEMGIAQSQTMTALIASILLSIIIAVLGVKTIEWVFAILGAPSDLIPLVADYMEVIYIGLPALVLSLIASSALRASGRMVLPEVLFGVAGVINLVLDVLLIFGEGGFPAMGVRGAAIATTVSWLFLAVSMSVLLMTARLWTFRVQGWFEHALTIARLSAPAVLTQILLPLTSAVVIFLAARFGPEAVAAFGVAQRIEMLGLVGVSALSVGLVPFVAQNAGAQKQERLGQGIAFSGRFGVYWGLILWLIVVVFSETLGGMFSDDIDVIRTIGIYFFWVGPSYAAYALVTLAASVLNGLQRPNRALQLLLIKTVGMTLPFMIIGSMWAVSGLFLGLSIANILGAMIGYFFIGRAMKTIEQDNRWGRIAADYIDDVRSLLAAFRH